MDTRARDRRPQPGRGILLLCLLASACSQDPDGMGGPGRGPDRDAAAGGSSTTPSGDAGDPFSGRPDDVPDRPNATGQPSGCVLPGEINEFGLPLCMPDEPLEAGVLQPDCIRGFDDLGRPVCLDDAGVPDRTVPPPACVRGGLCKALVLGGGGQLDILFLVDDSGSMREEQQALVREMPRLIDVLTSGDVDGDGVQDYAAARDLHVGVISSDMGIGAITGIAGCNGVGDDGVLQSLPSPTITGCATSYPAFLSYDASTVDPNQAASDFACIASLGTAGCGFEQQLESALKAITPSYSDRRFVNPPDVGHADGVNAGFVRPDSLLALVLVTDEEDCSTREPRIFTPNAYLDPLDPLYQQDLNLRCFYNEATLFPISRYVAGYQEVRPPGSNLVLFAAIVGVPPELVDDAARSGVDFDDATMRDAYYDAILAAPAMQPVLDPAAPPGGGTLLPSCNTANGRAYPPRRIVEVAKGFGANSVVQSICQDSFAPALELIAQRISESLTVGCLDDAFVRDAEGLVACDVIWELPPPGTPGASLQLCEERSYLMTPDARELRTSADGRTRCVLSQVGVRDLGAGPEPQAGASGWFYDDFSSEAIDRCGASSDQRVVFTTDVSTPADVRVYVDCAPFM